MFSLDFLRGMSASSGLNYSQAGLRRRLPENAWQTLSILHALKTVLCVSVCLFVFYLLLVVSITICARCIYA